MSEKTEKEGSRYGLGRVYQRGRVWWIQYSFRGEQHRESSESEKESEARKLLKVRLGEMGRGRLVGPQAERTSFSDLAKMIRDDYAINGRKSAKRLESSLLHLEGFFGLSRAPDITTDRIVAYVQERMEGESPAALATIKNELSALKRALNLARRAGRIADLPAFPILRVANTRKGFAEDGQVRTIVSNLSEHHGHAVTFLHITGWRTGEVIGASGITWWQVDLDAGWVRLDPGTTKNDEGRAFPLGAFPELLALMERRRGMTDAMQRETGKIVPWVFWHQDGKPIQDFRGSWARACKAAGVPGLLVHDLRRSAVRNLERSGVSRSAAMKLTGHKTASVYSRYAIVDESDLLEAVGKLAAHRQAVEAKAKEGSVIPLAKGRQAKKGTRQAQSGQASTENQISESA
jgi:integrase